MANYLKIFKTHNDYEEVVGTENEPIVSHIIDDVNIEFKKQFSNVYLTFVATENSTFKFNGNSINYSLDDGATWTNLASNTNSPTVNAGSKIMWKASLTPITSFPYGIGTFSSTGNFTVEGNPMSLLYGDNFIGKTDLTEKDYAFCNLFNLCAGMTSAKNLSLPATTLGENSYERMFFNCTSLTTAPELPATTLAYGCYDGMFRGCTSLTTAPSVLPATTLADRCYFEMFYGCTSLTTAPELLATTLAISCYNYMFQGCTSLTTAPVLSATTLANGCYGDMFRGCTSLTTVPSNMLPATTLVSSCYGGMFRDCTSLTTAPELPATTLADSCYNYMFNGCTSLTTAPVLSATTLANGCYGNMFRGCTSLTTVPSNMLPATTLANGCYQNMFSGCTSLTTAPELPATTLANGCYNYMFRGCTSLNYIKAMFTTTPSTTYMNNWVYGVASSGTFVKNSAATWTSSCGVSTYPCGWTVVDPCTVYDYVEIGGIKWATKNIGACSETDYGLYFQWGDTQGYTSSEVGSGDGKKYFGWADYKYCSGAGTSSSAMTKYNSGDNKTVLDAEDDAAKANWGGNWRIPTEEEYIALGAATTSAHTRVNNVNGVMLTSKTDSSKKLFFPFTGRCSGGSWYSGGIYGSYWSSSLHSDNTKSYQITVGVSYVHLSDSNIRMQGCSIRPVAS